MIHTDNKGRKIIGYWSDQALIAGVWTYALVTIYPNARDWVDTSWNDAERNKVILYLLGSGREHASYRGPSRCRFCDKHNGSREFTDGVYIWPSGLEHYLAKHGVKPPQEFIDHVIREMRT